MIKSTMTKSTRNPAIELYRVMLMFGICMLHSITQCGHNIPWMANILLSCVVGFVFITGWFGVKFNWRKILKLYGIASFGVLLHFVLMVIYARHIDLSAVYATPPPPPGHGWIWAAERCWKLFFRGYWFLHAYVFMMMLAPLVNAIVELRGKAAAREMVPLLVLVGCWGFGLAVPALSNCFPWTDGLNPYGGITLLGIYAGARLCRLYKINEKWTIKRLCVVLPILWILNGMVYGAYNSPFAFALAAVCFFLFARVRLTPRIARIIVFIAPSMFSVYLIHTHGAGFRLMRHFANMLLSHGIPIYVALFVTGVSTFLVALAIDMIRRAALAFIARGNTNG